MELMTPAPNCPFCRKLADPNGCPADDVVWNFPHSVAVLGPWQYFTGYCLLVSRKHASELSELGTDRAAFLEEMATLAGAIEACFQPHKLNYELLGNQVPHLHWHLFPRSAADPDRLRPVWFALEKADTDPAEKQRLETGTIPRAEAVAKLRARLQSSGSPKYQIS
jgi:diadenosine tetraphosphate (Ap4A) HIT family hydrolase